MDHFIASNGVTVETDVHGCISARGVNLLKEESVALREFCRAERDEELGRWRWPKNPRYVVYPDGTSRRVIDESTGQTMQVSLHDRKAMTTYLDSYVGAARDYDSSHPEPKPWHDAKIGEVWLLGFASQTRPAIVVEDDGAPWFMVADDIDTPSRFRLSSDSFTEARRIFPEVAK